MIKTAMAETAKMQNDVFGFKQKLRDRPPAVVTPGRPSGLSSVAGAASDKYRRRDFYLKIEGLTGPRKVPAKDSAA
jgi:hypothetical protein